MKAEARLWTNGPVCRIVVLAFAACSVLVAAPTEAAISLNGQVLGAGAPIANSIVTLFAASAGAPKQLAQARTSADGRFVIAVSDTPGANTSLYLVAQGGRVKATNASGDNPAIALMIVLGSAHPKRVTINEMTTVASVWTHAQFIEGSAISGNALGLRIAAGNVPNFVDLATGGYGKAIQDPLNSTQTPALANFGSLSNVLAGCVTRVKADACDSLFAASTPPNGKVPTDTLMAAQSVARNAAYKPERLFALLDAFYPVPKGKALRDTPYMPYCSVSPSAWILGLKFTGGGLNAPGKIQFDSEGNAWTGDNFIVGYQSQDSSWDWSRH